MEISFDKENSITRIGVTVNLQDEKEALSGAKEIVQQLRKEWDIGNVDYMKLSGGFTNSLLCFHQKSDVNKEDAIVLRVYGSSSDLPIDREVEIKNMLVLQEIGCGSPFYALFQNGIAYKFLPGTCLNSESARQPHISKLIAETMAKIHTTDPEKVAIHGIPKLKFDKSPCLFQLIRKFHSLIPEKLEDPKLNERYIKAIKSKSELLQEIEDVESHLKKLKPCVGWSHNDTYPKNMIYDKEKDKVTFIDYEFGAYNYLPFEIANFFCELAGVEDIDFNLYPKKEEQMTFLRHYLQAKNALEGNDPPQTNDLERLYVQVNKFTLSDHLLQGIWAMSQINLSGLDFDFLRYAETRLQEYFAKKEELFDLVLPL